MCDDVTGDPFELNRFVQAQDTVYRTVLSELRAGRKRSHWMWFVFPQLRGLGSSPTAVRFGITSVEEARAYLDHELLGFRLRECVRLVAAIEGRTAQEVFGRPDDMKLRSSMTLFAMATDDNADFVAVLDKFYAGEKDPITAARLT
ncbi:calpastatin [Mycobacteriaceae bacterium 1482268.1]|nr:calpastatin [Mycobacteriaceae bacterium 1482268.1]